MPVLPCHDLPQHVGEDAAVLVVVYLDGRVDAAAHGDGFGCACLAGDAEG